MGQQQLRAAANEKNLENVLIWQGLRDAEGYRLEGVLGFGASGSRGFRGLGDVGVRGYLEVHG